VIRTSGLDHIHLHVDDVQRSLAFYATVFGAEESFRVGEALVFLRLPGVDSVIALDGRPEGERNPTHVGLRLAKGEDRDAAVHEVEEAGGSVIERGEHAPGVHYAYVADPDGNVLEL
jgi:catechol 2,3-dioxygenase-like lactoylglutathione lyase family enzyme